MKQLCAAFQSRAGAKLRSLRARAPVTTALAKTSQACWLRILPVSPSSPFSLALERACLQPAVPMSTENRASLKVDKETYARFKAKCRIRRLKIEDASREAMVDWINKKRPVSK